MICINQDKRRTHFWVGSSNKALKITEMKTNKIAAASHFDSGACVVQISFVDINNHTPLSEFSCQIPKLSGQATSPASHFNHGVAVSGEPFPEGKKIVLKLPRGVGVIAVGFQALADLL